VIVCTGKQSSLLTDTETHFIGVKTVSVSVSVLWDV